MSGLSKRILILTHEFLPFKGGIATYCAEMAMAAVAMGHVVTIVAPDYGRDNSESDSAQPYSVKRFKGGLYKTAQMPRVIAEVLKVNPDDFDVVHAAEWSFVVALHLVQKFKRIPFTATMHGTDIFGFATSRLTRLLRATDTLKHADYVTANSGFTARLTKSQHPYIADENLATTLLGVNSWWFNSSEASDDVLKRYEISPDRHVLLTVARMDERKGHRRMLQALAMLPHEHKEKLTYVIVGECLNETYLAELHVLAKETGLPVIFTGKIATDEVRKLYQIAWLFCMLAEPHPVKVEGFGLVYLEAAAQSLPSLATPIGGVPEVVLHNRTGYLVEERTPQAVASALKYLIENPDVVSTYGQNAGEWAKTFTWQRCAEQTYNR